MRKILEQAQDEVRMKVRQLDESRSRKDLSEARGTLSNLAASLDSQIEKAVREEAPQLAEQILAPTTAAPPVPVSSISIGSWVRVPRWKSVGQVLDIQGNRIKVALGAMQVLLEAHEYELTKPPQGQSASRPSKAKMETQRPATPPSTLDVRGKRLDEAMSEVEQYLDQAYRCGDLQQVIVVHGLGTGALREGTRQILAKLPYIKTFQDGGPGQGGAGATSIEFE